MATVNTYLTFNGNCEEAFNFYKSIFGGEFTTLQRFKDLPSEHNIPEDEGEKIMHIFYRFSNETCLMGCDSSSMFGEATIGDNFSLSVSVDNDEECTRIFNALAQGGEITMPLQKVFWGALFGSLTDKFGINWMISHETPKA
ncbi:MAG: VOC family protein [Bacteroidota bacterium]|nr:VOC family protein [Bacteroidota bacterium]